MHTVGRFGLAVRRGKQSFGSPFFAIVVVSGYCSVTLSLTINKTLKWLSSLLIRMLVVAGI